MSLLPTVLAVVESEPADPLSGPKTVIMIGLLCVGFSVFGIAIHQGPRAVLRPPWPLKQLRDRYAESSGERIKLALARLTLIVGQVLLAIGVVIKLMS